VDLNAFTPIFPLTTAGQFHPAVAHSDRVKQGAHGKAPQGGHDCRQGSLLEADPLCTRLHQSQCKAVQTNEMRWPKSVRQTELDRDKPAYSGLSNKLFFGDETERDNGRSGSGNTGSQGGKGVCGGKSHGQPLDNKWRQTESHQIQVMRVVGLVGRLGWEVMNYRCRIVTETQKKMVVRSFGLRENTAE
jgi:hypothetical protein